MPATARHASPRRRSPQDDALVEQWDALDALTTRLASRLATGGEPEERPRIVAATADAAELAARLRVAEAERANLNRLLEVASAERRGEAPAGGRKRRSGTARSKTGPGVDDAAMAELVRQRDELAAECDALR